ncbi:MAG TPA: hypothetical protein VIG62_25700, partial [Blastocatellia bacterium]
LLLLMLAGSLLVASCRKKTPPTDDHDDAPQKPAYTQKGDEGSVTGVVNFEGQVSPDELRPINMSSDTRCAEIGGSNVPERFVVNNGKFANVFVYLKGGPADRYKFPAATGAKELDQHGCRYVPHVFGIQVGQPLNVINSDKTTHNVHSLSKYKSFNESQPAGAGPISKTFSRKETLLRIKCDQHGWMESWAHVLDHPFYAVTDQNGAFTIADVPPGDYTLVFVHEQLGEQTQKISVKGKEAAAAQPVAYKAGQKAGPISMQIVTVTLP